MAIIVAFYTLVVSGCYTVLAIYHETLANALTVPFVALLIAPCLYLNYLHLRRDKDA